MKQKIAIALCALSLMALLAGCNMGENNTSSVNDTSSVVSGNIPSDNTDGEYDNTSGNNSGEGSSETLDEEISSMISSGSDVINSMVD